MALDRYFRSSRPSEWFIFALVSKIKNCYGLVWTVVLSSLLYMHLSPAYGFFFSKDSSNHVAGRVKLFHALPRSTSWLLLWPFFLPPVYMIICRIRNMTAVLIKIVCQLLFGLNHYHRIWWNTTPFMALAFEPSKAYQSLRWFIVVSPPTVYLWRQQLNFPCICHPLW